MRVVVIDDSQKCACEGRCGVDWHTVEARGSLASTIRAKFGDAIELSFLDISSGHNVVSAEVLPALLLDKQPLPLLLIDGQVRIEGYFDNRMVCDVIEANMEMGG